MKKALLFMIALMLGLAAASPAMAIDWSAQGAINIMAAFYKNQDQRVPVYLGGPPGMNDFGYGVGSADPAWNRENFWVQERSDIFITARASQDLYGTIGFEIASYRFGDADATALGKTSNPGLGKDRAGRWNADAIAIQVKTMYIDFKVPEVPVWLRVGIQPFIIRPWVVLCDDGAGISARVVLKAGGATIGINPLWARIKSPNLPGTSTPTDWTSADDQDLFGVDTNVSIGPIKGGLYFIYQDRRQLYDTAIGEGDSQQWWFGPYLDLKMGPVAATLDFVYNGGYEVRKSGQITIFNVANPNIIPPTPQGNSRRHQGMLFRGEASYTWDKFRFGMGGLYGTGDDPTTKDRDEGYNVNFNGETAPVQRDFLITCGDWGLSIPFGATDNIIGFYKPWSSFGQGIWYVRGFADYQVLSWPKLLANTGYIGDTVRHGDEFGRDADDDKSIGWEIDAAAQVQLYRNLTFSSAFGYLIGGKALSMAGGDRPQDPWAWINTISFVF
jgi:hypothetical protein